MVPLHLAWTRRRRLRLGQHPRRSPHGPCCRGTRRRNHRHPRPRDDHIKLCGVRAEHPHLRRPGESCVGISTREIPRLKTLGGFRSLLVDALRWDPPTGPPTGPPTASRPTPADRRGHHDCGAVRDGHGLRGRGSCDPRNAARARTPASLQRRHSSVSAKRWSATGKPVRTTGAR